MSLVAHRKISVAVACRAAGVSRRAYYRRPESDSVRDSAVIDRLQATVAEHSRWGFWKCYHRLRLDGHRWNHKRVLRVYRQLILNLPRRTRKRLIRTERHPLGVEAQSQSLVVHRFHERCALRRPALPHVQCAGRRCTRGVGEDWCRTHTIELRYIQPGKPNQNSYIERFNEVLDAYLFDDLDQVREITASWMVKYNEQRPHDSLGNLPPSDYRRSVEKATNSPNSV